MIAWNRSQGWLLNVTLTELYVYSILNDLLPTVILNFHFSLSFYKQGVRYLWMIGTLREVLF